MVKLVILSGHRNKDPFNEMKALLRDPLGASELERLLGLRETVLSMQKDNADATLRELAKRTMGILSDEQFRCVWSGDNYYMFINSNGSIVLEAGFKDPINLAAKSLLYEANGHDNSNGKIEDDLLRGSIKDTYRLRFIVDGDKDDLERICRKVMKCIEVTNFKDYYAIPKVNRYRAIHVIGVPKCSIFRGKPIYVEIQFRTKREHEKAERGLAAHDVYKLERYGSNGLTFVMDDRLIAPIETAPNAGGRVFAYNGRMFVGIPLNRYPDIKEAA